MPIFFMVMNMRRLVVVAILALAVPQAAAEQSRATPPIERAIGDEHVDSFVDSLNIPLVVSSWEKMLVAQQQLPSCGDSEKDAKIRSAWSAAVSHALDIRNASVAAVRKAVSLAFTPEELRALHEFHVSPIGGNVLASEREAMAPDKSGNRDAAAAAKEAERAQKALDANPMRKKALLRLSEAAGGIDAQLDVLVNVQIGLASGMMAASKGQPQADPEEIAAAIEKIRPMLRAMVSSFLLVGYDSIYTKLSIAELDAYSDHLQSPVGRKSVAFGLRAYGEIMRTAMMVVGREFAKELNSQDL